MNGYSHYESAMNGVRVVTNLTIILGIIAFVMVFHRASNFLFLLVYIRLACDYPMCHIHNVSSHTYIHIHYIHTSAARCFFFNRLPMLLLFRYPVPTIAAHTHIHVRAHTQQNFHTLIHAIIHAHITLSHLLYASFRIFGWFSNTARCPPRYRSSTSTADIFRNDY